MSLLQKLRIKRAKRLERKLAKILGVESQQENIPEVMPSPEGHSIVAWDKVTKISEELNDCAWDFTVYMDTTKLLPGFIVYIIGKRAPTAEKPYVTYKPEPRVVSSIHDSVLMVEQCFLLIRTELKNHNLLQSLKQILRLCPKKMLFIRHLPKGMLNIFANY